MESCFHWAHVAGIRFRLWHINGGQLSGSHYTLYCVCFFIVQRILRCIAGNSTAARALSRSFHGLWLWDTLWMGSDHLHVCHAPETFWYFHCFTGDKLMFPYITGIILAHFRLIFSVLATGFFIFMMAMGFVQKAGNQDHFHWMPDQPGYQVHRITQFC